MNKFENLQSSINGTQFIKSYPMLNNLAITPSQKSFIELVLSFQNQGLEFFMEYSEISELLGIKIQTVSNLVNSLKSIEYISTSNTSRTNNGKYIGSTTFITINEDKILSDISEPKEIKKEVKLKIKNKMEKEELKTEIKERTFIDKVYESENDEQIIENVIEEPIQESTSLVELQYDEMITLDVIESDDMLTEIFRDDVKLSFDMVRTIAKKNDLNKETKTILFDTFEGVILPNKKYINKYLQFGGTKIKNELINN
jgi:DNA-binding MarR family transcriptional regulator